MGKCKDCGKKLFNKRAIRCKPCRGKSDSIDITGKRFGRLIAIRLMTQGNHTKHQGWLLKCDCGKNVVVNKSNLSTNSHTRSCGCLQRDEMSIRQTSHGLSRTRFYKIWAGMNTRCYGVNNPNYASWGGRGIKCLWKSFEEFHNDMYESYLEHCGKFGVNNTSIDRLNNDGHYSKDNCRWATPTKQGRNTRKNRILRHRGEEKCLSEWAEFLSIGISTLWARLDRGWSVERTIATPKMKNQFTKLM